MKNTYVLIGADKGVEMGWRLLLEEYDIETIERFSNRFSSGMGMNYIYDKTKGLNLVNMNKFSTAYKNNIIKWLRQGETVLLNPSGGMMLLTKDMVILDKKESDYFPILEEDAHQGLTGWLSPKGEFYPCAYGEHHLFANSYQGEDRDLFIKMSSSPVMESASDVFINDETLTVAQFNWMKKHKKYFNVQQIKILKNHMVFA